MLLNMDFPTNFRPALDKYLKRDLIAKSFNSEEIKLDESRLKSANELSFLRQF